MPAPQRYYEHPWQLLISRRLLFEDADSGGRILPHVPLLGAWQPFKIKTFIGFDHEQTALRGGRQQLANEVQHVVAARDIKLVRRRTEHDPGELLCAGRQLQAAAEVDE